MRDFYLYDDYDVTRNKLDIKDAVELQEIEIELAILQLQKLRESPIQGRFNVGRLQETHRRLYGDVYDWAGDICVDSNFTNGKSPDEITRHLNIVCDCMTYTDWKGLSLENQAHELADHMVEMWKTYPFRKGNTLACSEFICDFADAHGMPVEHTKFSENPEYTFSALALAAVEPPQQTSEYIYALAEDALKTGLEKQKTITNSKTDVVAEKVVEIKPEPKVEVVRSEPAVAYKEPVNRYRPDFGPSKLNFKNQAVKDTQSEFGG